MSIDDDRIRHALRDTAREPSTAEVIERVRAKHTRRRTVRRIEHGVLAAAVFVGVVTIGVVVLDESVSKDPQVAVAPGPGAAPRIQVTEDGRDHRASARNLRVQPDEGYVRGPFIATADGAVALAAYDRDGDTFTYPPSRIVLIEPNGTVVERIDLQGEILSLAEGEGARWALTHDKTVIGPEDPEFRVKRLGPDGSVASNAVPPGEQPAGRIAAGGGGVWVPVRDGVLRFDPVTGVFAQKITLSTVSEQRAVVAEGKFFFVTDGNARVRLDPAQDGPAGIVDALDADIQLTDATNVPAFGVAYLLGFDPSQRTWIASDGSRSLTLPDGFTATSIHASERMVWVDGTLDGARVVVVLEVSKRDLEVARTIRISEAEDTEVILVSPRTAIVAGDGSLYRVDLTE